MTLMPRNTRNKMFTYADNLAPSSKRAQCLRIGYYKLNDGESIAEHLRADHSESSGPLRAAELMSNAGCAHEIGGENNTYGTFVFEDGSTL